MFNTIFKFLYIVPYKIASLQMTEVFSIILKVSFLASIVGVILLIVKKALYKKISPGWQYLLWSVLILKLLIPFGPQASFSAYNAMPRQVAAVSALRSVNIPNSADNIFFDDELVATETTINPTPEDEFSRSILASVYEILPYVWFFGMLVMLLWFVYANISFRLKLKKTAVTLSHRITQIYEKCAARVGLRTRLEIVAQDIIKSPALFGFLRPRILLPMEIEDVDDKSVEYILLHEISHYKRLDNLMNYLLIFLQAVHWFNPLIWFYFKQIRKDMEMAADERVLRYLERAEHYDYAETLLDMAGSISQTLSPRFLCIIDDKKDMESRIRMIKLTNVLTARKKTDNSRKRLRYRNNRDAVPDKRSSGRTKQ